jgi:hypothetical protein
MTKMEENFRRRKDLMGYPPHWVRFYKGEDGKTYMQLEMQTDLEMPEDPGEAKVFGYNMAEKMGFPNADTMIMLNGKVLYTDMGVPNQYETQLVKRSEQHVQKKE